ncbi:hypothetical protein [Natronorubrum daqingense]|nr:hypothetical protein [Natronorubrum daqingense]
MGDSRTRIGIGDVEDRTDEDQISLVFSEENGETYLQTDPTDDPEGDTIGTSFEGEWADWRIQVDGGDVTAKVWESGTDEPEDWQLEDSFEEFEGEFFASAGHTDNNRELFVDQIDGGGNSLSGQVVDQSGEPIENSTVEGLGTNHDALNDTVEDAEAEAEQLLDDASDPFPDEWEDDFNLIDEDIFEDDPGDFADEMFNLETDLDDLLGDVGGEYAAVHTEDDWDMNAQRGTWASETLLDMQQVDPDLGEPHLVVDEGEQLVLSKWDATESGGLVSDREDSIDDALPGRTTSGEIVVEQLSMSGETTSTYERQTQPRVETTGSYSLSTKEHEAATLNPSEGIYRIYPEGNEAAAYFLIVGDPEDMVSNIVHDLEDEAGELTDRAQEIQDNIGDGIFERRTTTTDENGEFDLRMQSGVERATVQTYRADGEQLTDITGASFSDLRDVRDHGYNGTFQVGAPERHDVPDEDVTLETFGTEDLPNMDLDDLDEWRQWAEDQRLNETIGDMQSEYDERFDEMENATLESTYEAHKTIIEVNPHAEERYLEDSEFDSVQDADDLDNDELAEETGHMQTAILSIGGIDPPDLDDPLDIEDGELFAEYPVPDGIDEDTLNPEIHWADGSSEELGEDYWSIESGTFGSNTLTVEEFPIDEDDPAGLELRIFGGGEDGIIDDRISAENPAFQGQTPDVRAIDFNTKSPGSSDRVSMTFRTGDNDFEGVTDIEVFDPEGETIDADLRDDDRGAFETNGSGEHYVRATMGADTGDEFVETFSIRALEDPRSDHPTVRTESTSGDEQLALVGEGLRDAEVTVDDDRVGISAITPGDDTPSRLDVKPDSAMDSSVDNIDVRLLEGSDEATLDTSVETVIHFDDLDEDAAIWRGDPGWWRGEPMEVGETERYGEIDDRGDGKAVIRTFTESDGELSMYVNDDPDWGESTKHSIATSVPSIGIPFLPFSTSGAAGAAGGVVALGSGIVVQRRYLT